MSDFEHWPSGGSNPWKSVPETRSQTARAPGQPVAGDSGAPPPPDGGGKVVFDLRGGGLVPLAVKGYLLTLITLGIYRFWYITDLRRFFWNRTLVHGSALEYTGRGVEIFIGFLIALAVILPLNGLAVGATLGLGPAGGLVPLAILPVYGFLTLFAVYRSRRYRVNRTLWRGLRLHQTGSGWGYAARAAGWVILCVATLGLCVPWAEADLYRYRIERMHIGSSPFSFHGGWRSIAKPFALIWIVFVLPVATAVIALLIAVDMQVFLNAWVETGPGDWSLDYQKLPEGNRGLVSALIMAAIWIFAGIWAYPYYLARRTSAFFSNTEVAGVKCRSRVSARSYYKVYLVFFLALGLSFGFALPITIGLGYLVLSGLGAVGGSPIGIILATIVSALLFFALFGILKLVYLERGIWKLVAESTRIQNPAELDDLAGRIKDTEGGFGAGFADALDVGDFEVGL